MNKITLPRKAEAMFPYTYIFTKTEHFLIEISIPIRYLSASVGKFAITIVFCMNKKSPYTPPYMKQNEEISYMDHYF